LTVVLLGLGTNLGDRLANLNEAIRCMARQINVVRRSSVYETMPWGILDQPVFYNQVIKTETSMQPGEVLNHLKAIELNMGRQATVRNGPRLIDLDILFYDQLVLETTALTIPHPRMEGRAFVLVPLAELAPDWVHPLFHITAAEMLKGLDTSSVRRLQGNDICI
jgi:2-amino-4-hydroxy-6-hydroxymethyldihydropteridine diphosphokinase